MSDETFETRSTSLASKPIQEFQIKDQIKERRETAR